MRHDTPEVMLDGYKGHEDVPNNVTHVRFHPSVVTFRNQAFYNCSWLREVILNDGLIEIGDCAFYGCESLESITIPSTVEEIDQQAFISCNSLREVVLSDGLKKIGQFAFQSCTSLQSIAIPSSVTEIEKYAFINCNSLKEVVVSEGLLKKIRSSVFQTCMSLQRITIPATVDKIEQFAFMNCSTLREVVLCEHLPKISKDAFIGCTVKRLIRHYEIKEATTLFELALWKAGFDQKDISSPADRSACRIEVPGPVKDTILQYLGRW